MVLIAMSVRELYDKPEQFKKALKTFLCSSSERFCGFISEVALYQIFITITITMNRFHVQL